MSSEQQVQATSDLRSATQDYKRDAAHKQKWAHPKTCDRHGNPLLKPKPKRTSAGMGRPNSWKSWSASGRSSKVAHKQDSDVAAAEFPSLNTSDESGTSADEDHETYPPVDAGVMYSYDRSRGPASGSQILNHALAQAIDKYEDKETGKLVKQEYEMIDDDEEALGLTPVKKTYGKGGAVPIEDQDYEFV